VKEPIARQLGRRVRTLRVKQGMTQEKLAGLSGISLKYIQKIEGKNPPNIGLVALEKLTNGFGITLLELFKFR
jgi:transcriptional regulator with XRE-family HTH domain